MKKELIIFQHIVSGETYCWNGEYPVCLLPQGEVWADYGDLDPAEADFFESLIGGKKKSFELKNRGKFDIIHRIKITT